LKRPHPRSARRREAARDQTVSLHDKISLAELKKWARELLASSLVRELILDMDDYMPRWEALGQMLLLNKLLRRELNH